MRAMTSEDIFARWEVVREVWAAWTAFWACVARCDSGARIKKRSTPCVELSADASANANARVVRVNLGALGSRRVRGALRGERR